MKSAIKGLMTTAALAIVSTAAVAEPTVPDPISTANIPLPASATNSGLLFVLISTNPDAGNGGAAFSLTDYLGLNFNATVPTEMDQAGLTLTWHLGGLNSVPSLLANSGQLQWGVVSADSSGGVTTPGNRRAQTTVNTATSTSTALQNLTTGNVTGIGSYLTTQITQLNSNGQRPVGISTSPSDTWYAQNWSGAELQTMGGINDTLSFYQLANAGDGSAGGPATYEAYAGKWSFDLAAGTLTYSVSAVPIPAAVWLLLSGLGGLGVMGRRRKLVAAA